MNVECVRRVQPEIDAPPGHLHDLEETDGRQTIGTSRRRCSFAARTDKRPVPMAVQGAFVFTGVNRWPS